MATLKIRDLQVVAVVGVHTWEQERPITLAIDLDLTCDISRAAAEDDVRRTIDYEQLYGRIRERVEGTRYKLIERVARDVLEVVLDDPQTEHACVRVTKHRPLPGIADVQVEVDGSARPG